MRDAVLAAARRVLAAEPGVAVDYLALRGPDLGPIPEHGAGPAARRRPGRHTRLIDNVAVRAVTNCRRGWRAPSPGWTTEADVVVVGSGIAGLTAALPLRRQPALRVLVVTKDVLAAGSTRWAQGGIAAALGAGRHPRPAPSTTPSSPAPASATRRPCGCWSPRARTRCAS